MNKKLISDLFNFQYVTSKVFATDNFEMDWDSVVTPITGMLDTVLVPALLLFGSIGAVYCVVLGVKFAKAEEPQEREKAKSALKNAGIGFLLIFILISTLKTSIKPLAHWIKQIADYITSDDKIEENEVENNGFSPGTGQVPMIEIQDEPKPTPIDPISPTPTPVNPENEITQKGWKSMLNWDNEWRNKRSDSNQVKREMCMLAFDTEDNWRLNKTITEDEYLRLATWLNANYSLVRNGWASYPQQTRDNLNNLFHFQFENEQVTSMVKMYAIKLANYLKLTLAIY